MGTFTLGEGECAVDKRFVNMPAILTHLDDANPVLFSNIDASSKFTSDSRHNGRRPGARHRGRSAHGCTDAA
jgi:hypothetical protein